MVRNRDRSTERGIAFPDSTSPEPDMPSFATARQERPYSHQKPDVPRANGTASKEFVIETIHQGARYFIVPGVRFFHADASM